MNCQLCQKELMPIANGKFSGDMRTQVETHLKAVR